VRENVARHRDRRRHEEAREDIALRWISAPLRRFAEPG
jgi:hypothetical protein